MAYYRIILILIWIPLPYCVNEWNNLKADIRNAKSLNIFKKLIISEKKGNPLFSVMIHSV